MDVFAKDHFVASMQCIQKLMAENKDYLIELDSVIGDGDLGLTMYKGFTAGLEKAKSSHDADLGILFKQVGFAISKAAPSTMGTLMATAFIGAGKWLTGIEFATAKQFAHCFTIMAEAVSERGKAKEGEKTILDVLFPVGRAVDNCESDDICVRMNVALEQAKISVERTKELMNQHGKAAVFREKTIGMLDPGAVAAYFLIAGFEAACSTLS